MSFPARCRSSLFSASRALSKAAVRGGEMRKPASLPTLGLMEVLVGLARCIPRPPAKVLCRQFTTLAWKSTHSNCDLPFFHRNACDLPFSNRNTHGFITQIVVDFAQRVDACDARDRIVEHRIMIQGLIRSKQGLTRCESRYHYVIRKNGPEPTLSSLSFVSRPFVRNTYLPCLYLFGAPNLGVLILRLVHCPDLVSSYASQHRSLNRLARLSRRVASEKPSKEK
jgi:hypothetical protein